MVSNSRTQRKRTPSEEQYPNLINFGDCSSGGVLFLRVLGLETTQQRNAFRGGEFLSIKMPKFEFGVDSCTPLLDHLMTMMKKTTRISEWSCFPVFGFGDFQGRSSSSRLFFSILV